MPFQITINGTSHSVDADGDTPLLWVLRDVLGMTGTQVRLRHGAVRRLHRAPRRQAVRSCSTPVSAAAGKKITTIEGVGATRTGKVVQAWAKVDVLQCGYCQSGQIMSAVALLSAKKNPSDANIDAAGWTMMLHRSNLRPTRQARFLPQRPPLQELPGAGPLHPLQHVAHPTRPARCPPTDRVPQHLAAVGKAFPAACYAWFSPARWSCWFPACAWCP